MEAGDALGLAPGWCGFRRAVPYLSTMPDPFVHPEDPTAAAAIAGIGEELEVFDDWLDRY